uniref:GH18 domain-containing protein n=1 Tax=Opuntia streptacantha TaxID=393608 RepID=A0A7C9EUZ5_OPUST
MSMINNSSSRNSFIKSSIETATMYGFGGLDICLFRPNTTSDSLNMAALFHEWRSAVDSHYRSNNTKLILSMCAYYLPINTIANNVTVSYPVDSIQKNFDLVNIVTFDYFVPLKDKFAHPHAALYDPDHPNISTDYAIRQWIDKGLSAEKILIGLPYHGWAWELLNPKENQIGALTAGPAITPDGSVGYKGIKGYVQSYKAEVMYNSAYVENYCSFASLWVGFDDVDAIRAKVSYAREKGLGGYFAFQVANDENWILSRAAAQIEGENRSNLKRKFLIKVLVPLAFFACLVILTYSFRTTLLSYAKKYKIQCGCCSNRTWRDSNLDSLNSTSRDIYVGTLTTDVQKVSSKSPDLKVFKFVDISAATNNFSCHNKLGEGGYGPVYKVCKYVTMYCFRLQQFTGFWSQLRRKILI